MTHCVATSRRSGAMDSTRITVTRVRPFAPVWTRHPTTILQGVLHDLVAGMYRSITPRSVSGGSARSGTPLQQARASTWPGVTQRQSSDRRSNGAVATPREEFVPLTEDELQRNRFSLFAKVPDFTHARTQPHALWLSTRVNEEHTRVGGCLTDSLPSQAPACRHGT
jgi:hypothetical protein